ncbi:ABC transporter permease [Candidatus Njordibacter sp. Uisw_039]|jgi:ribose transport system permease protein|uniref:ABC transporter permease n=1 Tax=Candidatus Njordibacter sp. Uisw_039 TaxID=3230972 RepID=UPI003D3BD86E|tara:strand:- start:259 stop:1317 length:1059 start_codon:yes stop_codon:yes gene_type:complete
MTKTRLNQKPADWQTYTSQATNFIIFLYIRGGVLPWFLVLAVLGFSFSSEYFLTQANLRGISMHSTYLILVAMAQMLVMLTAGLDLSVGVMIAMTSVASSLTMGAMWSGHGSGWESILIGCVVGLGACASIGLVNSIGVAWFRVPAFIMTLGMSSIVLGLALSLTGGIPIYGMPPSFTDIFGYGVWAGIPVPILVTLPCISLMYIFLNWTRVGRYIYAIGGNLRAAQLSGINTKLCLVIAYTTAALFTGIAALLITARLETGESNLGVSYPLLSIAACAIGGVSLHGGIGKLHNVVLGAIFIILIQNGMNLMRINSYYQMVAIGSLLIISIMAENFRQRLVLTYKNKIRPNT